MKERKDSDFQLSILMCVKRNCKQNNSNTVKRWKKDKKSFLKKLKGKLNKKKNK